MLRLAGVVAIAAALWVASTPEWTADELNVLRDMRIETLGASPVDPTNRVAGSPAAARLGEALFSDPRFSGNGQVSCASCHRADYGFTDDVPLGRGVGIASRRTMPLAPAVFSPWQFWDGRADSLWAQALGPIENPAEHGSTRVRTARQFIESYGDAYRALFEVPPDLSDRQRFPEHATPLGDKAAQAAWEAMALGDRETVNTVFANFGKAFAAFERTILLPKTRFDLYVTAVLAGRTNDTSLTPDERAGLKLFIGKAGCVDCHSGPLLTNHGFANTGVPARTELPWDEGRIAGIRKALADPFNCRGAFSDAPKQCDELEFAETDAPELVRGYKVPSLRGVASRPPYMHAGQFRTLAQVIEHYDRAPAAPKGLSQLHPLRLSNAEQRKIEAFLMSLNPLPVRNSSEVAQQR